MWPAYTAALDPQETWRERLPCALEPIAARQRQHQHAAARLPRRRVAGSFAGGVLYGRAATGWGGLLGFVLGAMGVLVICAGEEVYAGPCPAAPAGAGSSHDQTTFVASAPPLAPADLLGALDRPFLRATQPYLSDDAFNRKWNASLKSPLLFLRAYPAGYHHDLLQVPEARILGGEGLCLGDAHPDNFGFLLLEGKTRFVYNDLDDSGCCPLAYDAARYFAALRLLFGDDALTRDVLERYVEVAKDKKRASDVQRSLLPDWDKVRQKGLDKYRNGGQFDYANNPALAPAPMAERSAIAAGANPVLSKYTISDVATVDRTSGGSGGLRRYWLLLRRGGSDSLFELKEAAPPGVDAGRHKRTLTMDMRLPVLKEAFWSTHTSADEFYVMVSGARFLLRDRLAKKSLSPGDLHPGDRKDVLYAQASIIALLHGPGWKGVKKDDLRAWLWDSSQTLAARWTATYKKYH